MNLLIDIGNYRVKWITSTQLSGSSHVEKAEIAKTQIALCNDSGLADSLRTSFLQLNLLEKVEAVIISTVSRGDGIDFINDLCSELWRLTPRTLFSSQYACGVSNHYEDPQSLGVDRWAALIGASSMNKNSSGTLVIDAGTAITVDYLDAELNFNGGIIFPGIATMISSLNQSTAKIFVEQQPIADSFVDLQNKNTRHAVSNGVCHCVISAIDRAIEFYESLDHSGFKTIITGGDASRIEHLSQYNMQIVPELVFIGIQVLSGEQGQ